MIRRALALLLVVSAPALAGMAADDDARIATRLYTPGEVVPLQTAAGSSIAVVLAPGEKVLEVITGDPSSVEVSVSAHADSVTVRTLRVPANAALSLRTNLRSYAFALQVGPAYAARYVLRFIYGPAAPGAAEPGGDWRITGEAALRPSRISDDGTHTYIEWPLDQPLPAVFAINALGDEEMVDGYMRGGVFTIDRVSRRLVFRIDRKLARAERLGPAGGR